MWRDEPEKYVEDMEKYIGERKMFSEGCVVGARVG
jgi:hypothetical protein